MSQCGDAGYFGKYQSDQKYQVLLKDLLSAAIALGEKSEQLIAELQARTSKLASDQQAADDKLASEKQAREASFTSELQALDARHMAELQARDDQNAALRLQIIDLEKRLQQSHTDRETQLAALHSGEQRDANNMRQIDDLHRAIQELEFERDQFAEDCAAREATVGASHPHYLIPMRICVCIVSDHTCCYDEIKGTQDQDLFSRSFTISQPPCLSPGHF